MVEITRKQRELERRAAEILSVAKPILIGEGFQALSMDRVAAQMEYAKGTIYNHFPNKEEIVLALAVQGMDLRRELFECASHVEGGTRRKLMAIGVACEYFTSSCHDNFFIEQLIRNHHIWDKSSDHRQQLIRQCEECCMHVVAGIVQQAIEAGDLSMPGELNPAEMVFGFWAISYGSQILTHSSPSLQAVGVFNPVQAIRVHFTTLLNGFNWKPSLDWETSNAWMNELTEQLAEKFKAIVESREGKS
ncbi:MAG: TetR/AcrR family transcriptional regulator [Pirellula sp.]|jgi:AcrR family transcriptional regulator